MKTASASAHHCQPADVPLSCSSDRRINGRNAGLFLSNDLVDGKTYVLFPDKGLIAASIDSACLDRITSDNIVPCWMIDMKKPLISRGFGALPDSVGNKLAEAHGNRTHQGSFSPPSSVLKTEPPTSDGCTSVRMLYYVGQTHSSGKW